jgi:hypothetical protein
MFALGIGISLAVASLGIVITALRNAPEAVEDEGGLQIVRQPVAATRGTAKSRRARSIQFHPRIKTA